MVSLFLYASIQCLYIDASSRGKCLVYWQCLMWECASSVILASGVVSCTPIWLESDRIWQLFCIRTLLNVWMCKLRFSFTWCCVVHTNMMEPERMRLYYILLFSTVLYYSVFWLTIWHNIVYVVLCNIVLEYMILWYLSRC